MSKLLWTLLLGVFVNFNAMAEDVPTVVFGAAETKDGGENMYIVEQPKDAPNPLGNPLPNPDKPVEVFGDVYPQNTNPTEANNQSQSNQSQQNLGNDFENTLLEANGRVYDIQSYPKADFKAMENPSDPKTIYSPNVNN